MKTETAINITLFAALGLAIWYLVEKSKDFIGDDPLGVVGGDDPCADPESPEYPGALTWFYMWLFRNPEAGTLGTPEGSMWDWDPFNILGRGSEGGIFW